MKRIAWCVVFGLALAGCSDDSKESCEVGTRNGCSEGLVCELKGEEPACVPEFVLAGSVKDASGEAVAAAVVIAVDVNGTGVGLAKSDLEGKFEMQLSWPRDEEAKPLEPPSVTLRVGAAGYQPFPQPPRVALPVDLTSATFDQEAQRWIVTNAATEVMLLPIQGDTDSLCSVEGRVDGEESSGVLVLGLQTETAVSSALSGPDGSFVLFNVPKGATDIQGFKAGVRYVPTSVNVQESVEKDILLVPATGGITKVTGTVQMVNASGEFDTSVLLVPEALFDPTTARGEAPAGLRAEHVSGAFAIEGVPPGKWVALAAFETDGLVRDPDLSIGGTDVVHFETTESGGDLNLGDGFKITGALAVLSPGAGGMETVTSAPITLSWEDDSSEKGYDLIIYDALGNVVMQANDLPSVEGGKDGAPSYTWAPESLESGMIYQFRVRSWRGDSWDKTYISQTEDLEGVFLYLPEESL